MTQETDWNALHLMTPQNRAETTIIADVFFQAIDEIESHIEDENRLIRAGRVDDVLALLDEKNRKALNYARATDLTRRNFVALTRFIPDRIADMKERQQALVAHLQENSRLLATIRTLSESLLREVAQDTQAKQRVTTYGQNGRATKPSLRAPSSAIIVSTSM